MEKKLVIKIAGTGEPKEILLHPGVTTAEIFETLHIPKSLALKADQNGTAFGLEEVLWDRVEDGQKLWAVPGMPVGRR